MAEKTFMKITNRDIYNRINSLHEKHDKICTTLEVHTAKILCNKRAIIAISGSLGTIATATIIFLLTTG